VIAPISSGAGPIEECREGVSKSGVGRRAAWISVEERCDSGTKSGERSKPPSVRPGIRLSVRAVRGCAAGRSGYHGTDLHRWGFAVPSILGRLSAVDRAMHDPWFRTTFFDCRPISGLAPVPLGQVRTHHRSGRDVSFLFQSQRSPAPDLRPVTCPNRWGDFPRARRPTRRVAQRYVRGTSPRDEPRCTAASSPTRPPRQPGSLSQRE